MVGREMLKVLEEFNFPVGKLIPIASDRSAGTDISFKGEPHRVLTLEAGLAQIPELVFFSAGGKISREWATRFTAIGCTVIDNSSAWRMEAGIPLVVPEVNPKTLNWPAVGPVNPGPGRLIANPNCSTIQLVVALAPLHKKWGIKRLVISTYQSVTGTGKAAVMQMENERSGFSGGKVYPHEIDLNCLPHCDIFLENDYTREEMKLVFETRKILSAPDIAITATAVRVPVMGGHSESVNIEFKKTFGLREAKKILSAAPGLVVMDEPSENIYPTPCFSLGKNEVFVGRIRRDESIENGLNLWIVADNLRKGAATNAIQIAQALLSEAEA